MLCLVLLTPSLWPGAASLPTYWLEPSVCYVRHFACCFFSVLDSLLPVPGFKQNYFFFLMPTSCNTSTSTSQVWRLTAPFLKDFPTGSCCCFTLMAFSVQLFFADLFPSLPFELWKITCIKPFKISFHGDNWNWKLVSHWLSFYISKH